MQSFSYLRQPYYANIMVIRPLFYPADNTSAYVQPIRQFRLRHPVYRSIIPNFRPDNFTQPFSIIDHIHHFRYRHYFIYIINYAIITRFYVRLDLLHFILYLMHFLLSSI